MEEGGEGMGGVICVPCHVHAGKTNNYTINQWLSQLAANRSATRRIRNMAGCAGQNGADKHSELN